MSDVHILCVNGLDPTDIIVKIVDRKHWIVDRNAAAEIITSYFSKQVGDFYWRCGDIIYRCNMFILTTDNYNFYVTFRG